MNLNHTDLILEYRNDRIDRNTENTEMRFKYRIDRKRMLV